MTLEDPCRSKDRSHYNRGVVEAHVWTREGLCRAHGPSGAVWSWGEVPPEARGREPRAAPHLVCCRGARVGWRVHSSSVPMSSMIL
eukprot:234536-Prymnesium_polylepis.2